MNKIASKDIVRSIVGKIFSGELCANDRLPSENQIAIKYGVSRMMATKAYLTLKQIGAIYSKPKKGFYVAEHFSGIIRSIDDKYSIDATKDEIIDLPNPIFSEARVIEGNFSSFKREHFKNDELIIVSHNWFDAGLVQYEKEVDFLSKLIWGNKLVNSASNIEFEQFDAFDQKQNLVLTTIYYSESGIPFIQKAVIKSKYFKLTKNEWAI